eukprot:CAMPEP_0179041934 /NCGR_PEP_ID=MMETSP0796-20121207/16408_1 /TAXON_ID=73915 /ORGANISM="Pyrodinium bahamense, Strain pbaha01" /LENGTH=257 /DNA_ID=CAMNT_0020738305 /DNA_START=131 /DNA_END=902 /DNA_ORIENTATION=-
MGFTVLLCDPQAFTGSPLAAPRGSRLRSALQAGIDDYPELSRVEDLIYDSCVIKEGKQEIECLRTWDKLKRFHKDAALECNLDDMRCVVLDVLDRLCEGIDGQEGLVLLNKVSAAVLAFRDKFTDWETAFTMADTDNSGDLSLNELIEAMKSVGAGMTDAEVKLVFVAADTNRDGVISKEEFSDFLTAAVFEPLRDLQVDKVPKKQLDFNDYLHWSSAGRTESWAGLAKLVADWAGPPPTGPSSEHLQRCKQIGTLS